MSAISTPAAMTFPFRIGVKVVSASKLITRTPEQALEALKFEHRLHFCSAFS